MRPDRLAEIGQHLQNLEPLHPGARHPLTVGEVRDDLRDVLAALDAQRREAAFWHRQWQQLTRDFYRRLGSDFDNLAYERAVYADFGEQTLAAPEVRA